MPTTASKRAATSLDDVLAEVGVSVPAKKARKPKAATARTSSTPVRGPDGKFLPGRVYSTIHGTKAHVSERSRVKAIRAKRRVVLNALKEARAARKAGAGVPRGTIKNLRDASRKLLNQIRLTRGL